MCTIFYQPQRYCGISILINFSLWGMSVVVGVALRLLTNAFLHICELHKYAHIVAHLHVPCACKGGYRQDAVRSLISPSLVAGRVCSCRMARMHRLSVMIFLLPLRFSRENRNVACAFAAKQPFLSALFPRLKAVFAEAFGIRVKA